jgi:hypothetical protein
VTDDKLIDAAQAQAALYDGDSREGIKTEVMNAFYAGAKFVSEAPATPRPAAGETWFVKLPGAVALTELHVRQATELTVLASVNGDWRDTRWAIADLTWVEKKA